MSRGSLLILALLGAVVRATSVPPGRVCHGDRILDLQLQPGAMVPIDPELRRL